MASTTAPETEDLFNALHLLEAGELEKSRDVLLGLIRQQEKRVSAAVFLLLGCVLLKQPSLTPKLSKEYGNCTDHALERRSRAAPEDATRSVLAALEAAPPTPHNLMLQGSIHLVYFKDHETAARLYRRAADQGLATAQHVLGFCYQNGQGVEQNKEEAVRLLRLAADQGCASAQAYLAFCYECVEEDQTEAVRLYRLAADQGEAGAQLDLANCYERGQGIEQDLVQAVRLFGLAADQGEPNALYRLADCWRNGQGVKQDLVQAARLYKMAADQGNIFAEDRLAETDIAHAWSKTPWSRQEPQEFGARAEETLIATLCSAKVCTASGGACKRDKARFRKRS